MNRNIVLLFSILGAGGACGGDLDPGAGDSAGKGTSTLLVNGDITARPRLTNARDTGDFDTEISVRVSLNLQFVATGTVMVTSSSGKVPLTFRPDRGRWEGTASGYDQVYVLDVESGADAVQGVRVDGPDIHVFKAPTIGATLDSTQPLRVQWDSDQTADSASISVGDIERLAIPDNGDYTLAAGSLRAERDQPRQNTIELSRMNRVTPAGAVGGSDFSVTVENWIEVVAQPNPAL